MVKIHEEVFMNLREDGDPDEEEGKEMTRGTSVTQKEVKAVTK